MLGTPFFLMDHVDGIVPPDVMPYTFGDNWFADAPAEQQRELQDSTVEVIAKLHSIPERREDLRVPRRGRSAGSERVAPPLRLAQGLVRVRGARHRPLPAGGAGADWLEDNFPDDVAAADPVLAWGDSRIGNVLYQDFRPVAVLDWEMATVGPRETGRGVDHLRAHGLSGARRPGRTARAAGRHARGGRAGHLRRAAPASNSATCSGSTCTPGVIWGCVFMRTSARRVRFGEIEKPDDVESLFYHASLLKRLIGEDT